MNDRKLVLDIGQCSFDHSAISSVLEQLGAEVIAASDLVETREVISRRPVTLALVNRVLDRDGSDGMRVILELVSWAKETGSSMKVMLVSNYAEYQDKAVRVGALRGFGKNELRNPKTRECLLEALSSGDDQSQSS